VDRKLNLQKAICTVNVISPLKDGAQTASFKGPAHTAL
jgi:hypothetical protein